MLKLLPIIYIIFLLIITVALIIIIGSVVIGNFSSLGLTFIKLLPIIIVPVFVPVIFIVGWFVDIVRAVGPSLRQRSWRRLFLFLNRTTSEIMLFSERDVRSRQSYSKHKSFLLHELNLRQWTLGEEHPDVINSLNSLANLHGQHRRYAEAEPLLLQSLDLTQRVLGEEHPNFAVGLLTLAQVYREQGRYVEAEPLLLQSLDLKRRVLGEEHPRFADSLIALAQVYCEQRRYAEAELLFFDALELRQEVLGEEHPDVANSLAYLSLLKVKINQLPEALRLMAEEASIEIKGLGRIFSASTDAQRLEYLQKTQTSLWILISLAVQNSQQLPEAVPLAFQQVLRHKALGTEAGVVHRTVLLSEQYQHLSPQLEQLQHLDDQLAALAFQVPTSEELSTYQAQFAALSQQRDALDRQLCRQIPEMNLQKQLETIDCRSLAEALPKGSVLVEFLYFCNLNFKAVPAKGESQWLSAQYVAFILSADQPSEVQLIDLGEAAPIDQLVKLFRQLLSHSEKATTEWMNLAASHALTEIHSRDFFLKKQSQDSQSHEPEAQALYERLYEAVSQDLYQTLIVPLEPYLKPQQQVFLAPDGELSCLPFHLLPNEAGQYLMENYSMSYLTVGRDLLRFRTSQTIKVQPTLPLVIADPDYNLALVEEPTGSPASEPSVFCDPSCINQMFDETSRQVLIEMNRSGEGEVFNPLPGTRIEGETVAAKLGVTPLFEAKALRSQVSQCQSPLILHMATHGYFLEDFPTKLPDSALSEIGRLYTAAHINPSIRSGLAFAGANTALKGGILPPEAEDGLLTTQAAANMNLLATQLVVASACQTALGNVLVGEGVLGLRRAFALAGAQTLVMSLWKVDDVATAILMERFYHNLLDEKMGRAQALKLAQFYVRDLTIGQMREQWLMPEAIAEIEQRSQGVSDYLKELAQKPNEHQPFVHPQYWGAFICQGNPDPLPSLI